jgi:hypothetical protein
MPLAAVVHDYRTARRRDLFHAGRVFREARRVLPAAAATRPSVSLLALTHEASRIFLAHAEGKRFVTNSPRGASRARNSCMASRARHIDPAS